MMSPSLVMLSSQMALQHAVDVIANNVANSSTTGFKREGIDFSTVLGNTMGKDPIAFVAGDGTFRDTTAGTLRTTGNPLDLGIQGQGYFEVRTPQGTRYTRNGALQLDNQGQLVTSSGQPVLSDGGQPLVIPDDAYDITISGDGFITAQEGTGTSRAQLGKLAVVKFASDQAMTPEGSGLYSTTQQPQAAADNAVVEGVVEESNVKPVVEMTDLIRVQRAYEQATNLISQENGRLDDAISKLSQVPS